MATMLASRSLPDLTNLDNNSDDDTALSTTDRPPSPTPPPLPRTPPSPSHPNSDFGLQRTPNGNINGHRKSSYTSQDSQEEEIELPVDLREALDGRTPKGSFDLRANSSESRSRSESPLDFRRGLRFHSPTSEEEEYDDEEYHGRRRLSGRSSVDGNEDEERERFSLHHDGPSEYSIHSAPAEFDSPTPGGTQDGAGNARRDGGLSSGADDHDRSFMDGDSPSSPSSPTTPSHRMLDGRRRSSNIARLPFSLFEYLQEEIRAGEMDEEEGVKSERVTNFLTVPGEVEKIILFGVIICLDSFLYTFTILPLRTLSALYHLVSNTLHNVSLSLLSSRSSSQPSRSKRRHLRLAHKCDLTKALIVAGTLFALHRITDASQMYHNVKGQETIKLYVLFNVLEIADRLCCSFGQDLQDSLFSRLTFGRRTDGSRPHIRPVALFALNTAYVIAHSLVLFYQLVTLNVAINSFSNALITLLLSNQFVEIKGSVFKKFEKENLFQITCADIVERFQLALMLFIIALRNWIELSSATSATSSFFSFLPASFSSISFAVPSLPSLSLLQAIFSPAIVVLLSECVVDWLKHAFITKFNHIRPAVYGRFIDVLCKDLVSTGPGRRQDQPFVDQSPLLSRRLGFASLPLGCLVVRVIFQAFETLADDSHIDECAPRVAAWSWSTFSFPTTLAQGEDLASRIGGWVVIGLVALIGWACLIVFKLLIGINLRAYASARWEKMEENLKEEDLNSRSRPPIGVTAKERELEREAAKVWDDDSMAVPGKKAKVSLTTLSRYEMIRSRVW